MADGVGPCGVQHEVERGHADGGFSALARQAAGAFAQTMIRGTTPFNATQARSCACTLTSCARESWSYAAVARPQPQRYSRGPLVSRA